MHLANQSFLRFRHRKPRQKIAYHLELKKEASTSPASVKLLRNCPQFVLTILLIGDYCSSMLCDVAVFSRSCSANLHEEVNTLRHRWSLRSVCQRQRCGAAPFRAVMVASSSALTLLFS